MKKISALTIGLFCLTSSGARSETFEQQVLRTSQNLSAAVQQARQGGPAAGSPLDALDEKKIGIAARFIAVQPGEFEMGSPINEYGRRRDEAQHHVRLTNGFEMQATAVTQLQYFLVTGVNPSYFKKEENCDHGSFKVMAGKQLCLNHPVEEVSWNDVQKFIEDLNRIQNKCVYRLPTEAEREYATRGGMPASFPFSFNIKDGYDYIWSYENSSIRTHAVAAKKANPWGLYDMHGNVWEWVQDRYGNYPMTDVANPAGPTSGSERVMRGGSWYDDFWTHRSANRNYAYPSDRHQDNWPGKIGFRLARSCR